MNFFDIHHKIDRAHDAVAELFVDQFLKVTVLPSKRSPNPIFAQEEKNGISLSGHGCREGTKTNW
jgi:hypothetical protein